MAYCYTSTLTLDHLSDPQSDHSRTNLLSSTRRSWKMCKGKKEVVWSPALEDAFLAGLNHYRPPQFTDLKSSRPFPKRNKIISDWIFNATRVRRTPRQVGSRIQQMRESRAGREYIALLEGRYRELQSIGKRAQLPHNSSGPSYTMVPTPIADSAGGPEGLSDLSSDHAVYPPQSDTVYTPLHPEVGAGILQDSLLPVPVSWDPLFSIDTSSVDGQSAASPQRPVGFMNVDKTGDEWGWTGITDGGEPTTQSDAHTWKTLDVEHMDYDKLFFRVS
ncbi:hypothetical protein PLICRDRAFT_178917 [Plicaturopsis crispa FD-325 SS-3]|uniref:Unplaced genomic scaffold PLICRscaffold_15, whole genome shotgun sequence n=1 Tax=Plicaturopsis crispa FD-325 SS-3 TaxID=944288 RepID=A0A0C9SS08_PLICR|nr:hypothetical protein PLICRDRAFT_178917 [Plicaturopsis crispa FD-325 SS-3]